MQNIFATEELINLFIALWSVFAVGIILWALYDWTPVEDKYQEEDLKRNRK